MNLMDSVASYMHIIQQCTICLVTVINCIQNHHTIARGTNIRISRFTIPYLDIQQLCFGRVSPGTHYTLLSPRPHRKRKLSTEKGILKLERYSSITQTICRLYI